MAEPRPRSPAMGTRRGVTGLAVAAVVAAASPLSAQDWKEFRTARQVGAVQRLDAEVLYGAGRLTVGPAEAPLLYDVRMRYDAERFKPVRRWTASEDGLGTLRVSVQSATEAEEGEPFRLGDQELDFNVQDLKRLGDSAGWLAVRLGTGVPTTLRLTVGAAESVVQLGGLALTRLEVTTGASDTRLSFDRPNPAAMDELLLKAGAASFQAEGLGNAGFERLTFEGGVGQVTLSFGGEWKRSARGSVKMGLGELRLRVPGDLGVRIVRRSVLSAFDAEGFIKTGDGYETANWASAAKRLELELEATFGAISVEVIP